MDADYDHIPYKFVRPEKCLPAPPVEALHCSPRRRSVPHHDRRYINTHSNDPFELFNDHRVIREGNRSGRLTLPVALETARYHNERLGLADGYISTRPPKKSLVDCVVDGFRKFFIPPSEEEKRAWMASRRRSIGVCQCCCSRGRRQSLQRPTERPYSLDPLGSGRRDHRDAMRRDMSLMSPTPLPSRRASYRKAPPPVGEVKPPSTQQSPQKFPSYRSPGSQSAYANQPRPLPMPHAEYNRFQASENARSGPSPPSPAPKEFTSPPDQYSGGQPSGVAPSQTQTPSHLNAQPQVCPMPAYEPELAHEDEPSEEEYHKDVYPPSRQTSTGNSPVPPRAPGSEFGGPIPPPPKVNVSNTFITPSKVPVPVTPMVTAPSRLGGQIQEDFVDVTPRILSPIGVPSEADPIGAMSQFGYGKGASLITEGIAVQDSRPFRLDLHPEEIRQMDEDQRLKYNLVRLRRQ